MLVKPLAVMDATAFALCRDQKLPINVFSIFKSGALKRRCVDENVLSAIVGLDVVQVGNAETGVGDVLKYKLADKKGALDSVARHLGMFNDKLDLKVTDALADRLARARKRNGE